MAYPSKGILSSFKKKWASKPWRKLVYIAKWKKPIWESYILHGSNYVTFWRGKTMETVKRSVVARGWGDRWMVRVILRALQLFCTILWWWIYVIIHLFRSKNCKITRVNSNVSNYEHWVIMMCQCRFMDYKKYTTLVEYVDIGETVDTG